MNDYSDVAVLIMSCDKNTWLLDIFLKSFFRFSENRIGKIYVSLENSPYCYRDGQVSVICSDIKLEWSGRLKYALEHISEKYVLLFMDDYILEEPIRFDILSRYLNLMRTDGICDITLRTINEDSNDEDNKYEELIHRARYGKYKTVLQASLWDKTYLRKLIISNKENAWEFETFSNIRSFPFPDSFYMVRDNKFAPFVYNDGFFAVHGAVIKEEKERIEKKLNISINLPQNVKVLAWDDMKRDDANIFQKIIRRTKIMIYYVFYRGLSLFKRI